MPAVDVHHEAVPGGEAGVVAKDVLEFLARSPFGRALQHLLALKLACLSERPFERVAEQVRPTEPEGSLFEHRQELGKVHVPPKDSIRGHVAIKCRVILTHTYILATFRTVPP